ncbi:DUF397 domain-containing protein [Streptomycetaceae bacterium NBC_01309]
MTSSRIASPVHATLTPIIVVQALASNCVEVSLDPRVAAVRDGKRPDAALAFPPAAWAALTGQVTSRRLVR